MTDHFVEVPKKVLSPDVMAVLDAFLNGYICNSADNSVAFQADRNGLAAAFCKLADKVAPVWKTPPSGEYELEYGQWIAQNRIRRDILAIATELKTL